MTRRFDARSLPQGVGHSTDRVLALYVAFCTCVIERFCISLLSHGLNMMDVANCGCDTRDLMTFFAPVNGDLGSG